MKRQLMACLLLVAPFAGLLGCDRTTQLSSVAPARPAVLGNGIITGKIHIHGSLPAPQVLSEAGACHPGSSAVYDESIVVNPGNTLAGVIVYLKDIPPANYQVPPSAVLNQQDCRYVPHVLALQTGQRLIVRNADSQFHNVDIHSSLNPGINSSMAGGGELEPINFATPEFFRITCDVHAWMSAEVGVFSHPFFAVTGDDGSFSIPRIPPGTYTLAAHQERLGEVTAKVSLTEDQSVSIDLTYEQPK